jgi:hypothetical protein
MFFMYLCLHMNGVSSHFSKTHRFEWGLSFYKQGFLGPKYVVVCR